MRKILKQAVFFLLIGTLLLTGCKSDVPKQTDAPATATPTQTAQVAETTQPESTDSQSGKTLVIYFSATGSTEKVANYIAEITGGDLFRIEPAEEYSSQDLNYNNPESRVSREHSDSEHKVELKTVSVPDWDKYTTVFIGYPVWWGEAAYPVQSFVKQVDFSNKTVIPFCTSASSALGESANKLKQNTGSWQTGKRFSSSAAKAEVQDWVNSLK
mgnify:CR=1 FL=1